MPQSFFALIGRPCHLRSTTGVNIAHLGRSLRHVPKQQTRVAAQADLLQRGSSSSSSSGAWYQPFSRAASSATNLSSEFPESPPRDILEDYPVSWAEGAETENELQHYVDPGEGVAGAGVLARKMWSSARRGIRSEDVWAKYSQRVITTGALFSATDIAIIFLAFARIKYRDKKVLDSLSPLILRDVNAFTLMDVVLLLNAHKKLEYERLDNIKLLLGVVCERSEEWTGRHVQLTANAVAHFYIYQPSFWRLVSRALPKLVWSMNALELSNLVAAMARVDRRDLKALLQIARMSRRCAHRNLFSQETLAIAINSFAKLDFNNSRLAGAFERAVVVKLDRALELGKDYRKSSLREVDVFDVQALTLLSQSLICLMGTSEQIIEKLLTLVSWSLKEFSDFQKRTLKTVCVILRRHHPELCRRLPYEVRDVLYTLEKTQAELPTTESRWSRELRGTLRKMDITNELKPVVDAQVLDIVLPTSKAVVCALGPYSYYTGGTQRTAYSKLHQRLLEAEGYTCMTVPYYEWSELKTEEDQMVYLWSLGRRAAARVKDSDNAGPAMDAVDALQTDLSDIGESGPIP